MKQSDKQIELTLHKHNPTRFVPADEYLTTEYLDYNFDSETEGDTGGWNFWKKITGKGLTDAQKEANAYSARMAEDAFERQTEFYDKYQSTAAQIRQLKESGVNPFGIGGGVSSQGPVSSSAPQSAQPASGSFSLLQGVASVVSAIMGIRRQSAEIKNINAQTKSIETQTPWIDRMNEINYNKMASDISLNSQKVNESIQSVKESVQRINESNSRIEVNGSVIDLNMSTRNLNVVKSVVENLNAEKLSILMPYVQAREEAEISFVNASDQKTRHEAEKAMYDANMSMLQTLKEADLIDKGYYDYVMQEMEYASKNQKRNFHWKPVNDIFKNISLLSVGVGSMLGNVSFSSPTKIGFK